MTVKFAHEFQHKATYLFFYLRHGFSDPRLITMAEQNSPLTTPAPHERQGDTMLKRTLFPLMNEACDLFLMLKTAAEYPLQGEHRLELNVPELVGNTIIRGVPRGDSGYGLEEALLGGRLRHRRLHNQANFGV